MIIILTATSEIHKEDQQGDVEKTKQALEPNIPQNICDDDFVQNVVSNVCNEITNVETPTDSTVEKGIFTYINT